MEKPLNQITTLELLELHANLMDELSERKILRTMNNPVAGYAEYLTCKTLSLTPARNSEKGFDAFKDKIKYEVKSRRITKGKKPIRYSAIRQINEQHFDFLIAIIFESNFLVRKAIQIPYELVLELVRYQKLTNSWILPVRESYTQFDTVKDLTLLFIDAQKTG